MRPYTQNLRWKAKDNFIDCARDEARSMEHRIDALSFLAGDLERAGHYGMADELRRVMRRMRNEIDCMPSDYKTELDTEFPTWASNTGRMN